MQQIQINSINKCNVCIIIKKVNIEFTYSVTYRTIFLSGIFHRKLLGLGIGEKNTPRIGLHKMGMVFLKETLDFVKMMLFGIM